MHIGCFEKKMESLREADNSLQWTEAMSPTCPLFGDSTVLQKFMIEPTNIHFQTNERTIIRIFAIFVSPYFFRKKMAPRHRLGPAKIGGYE